MMRRVGQIFLAGAAVGNCQVEPAKPEVNYQMAWDSFKKDFGKTYSGDVEELQRFAIFKVNIDTIYRVNAGNFSFKLGVTEFADMTATEFSSTHFGLSAPSQLWGSLPSLGSHEYKGEPLAPEVDWTKKNAVTQVKNQQSCGSCWSFSTTGSLEGAWAIASGKLTPLSEQQFVDCDQGDSGCNGGLMDTAFQYAEQNALCTEESYPYLAKVGQCKADSKCTVGIPKGAVAGFKDVPHDDKEAMMSALQQQPVSIAIEADKTAFQLYHSGVLTATCGDSLDHGVLAVGYGSEDGQDYWLVKNSWGPSWGVNGYIKLARGQGGSGECGILKQASYPVVKKAVEGEGVVVV